MEFAMSGDQGVVSSPEPVPSLVAVFLLGAGVAADPLSFASGLAEVASGSVLAALLPLDVVSLHDVHMSQTVRKTAT